MIHIGLVRTLSSTTRHLLVNRVVCQTGVVGARRGIVVWIPPNLDMRDMKEEIDDFADRADLMGSDPYPYFRKEYMKRKERRFNVHNRWKGKISQYKVRGLVELIEFKRANKYQ